MNEKDDMITHLGILSNLENGRKLARFSNSPGTGGSGARAYLDTLTPNLSLWALPGPRLAEYVDRVAELSKANEVLTRFHKLRRKDVEAGGAPSVKQSLVRLEAKA